MTRHIGHHGAAHMRQLTNIALSVPLDVEQLQAGGFGQRQKVGSHFGQGFGREFFHILACRAQGLKAFVDESQYRFPVLLC